MQIARNAGPAQATRPDDQTQEEARGNMLAGLPLGVLNTGTMQPII